MSGISDKFSVGKDICVITRWMFIKLFGISKQSPKGSQEVYKKFQNKYHFVNVGKMALELSCINSKKMHDNDKTFKAVALFLKTVCKILKTVALFLKTVCNKQYHFVDVRKMVKSAIKAQCAGALMNTKSERI